MAKKIINALPPGTTLQNGKYIIQKALCQCSYEITYLGKAKLETKCSLGSYWVDTKVVIEELFLKDHSVRQGTSVSCCKDSLYLDYNSKFWNEGQRHCNFPNKPFAENNTVYYVMTYNDDDIPQFWLISRKVSDATNNMVLKFKVLKTIDIYETVEPVLRKISIMGLNRSDQGRQEWGKEVELSVLKYNVYNRWADRVIRQDDTETSSEASVSSATGTIGGHGYVDLGLSVKWATCNVGANSPEGIGSHFAWGEITKKETYTDLNSKTYGMNLGDISGNPSYDAARANWGSTWRMPTKDEFQELVDNCDWRLTTLNGKKGHKVTSKKNNNSIFLPPTGYRDDSSLMTDGENGAFWTSTPNEQYANSPYGLRFYSRLHDVSGYPSFYGHSVRPVSE